MRGPATANSGARPTAAHPRWPDRQRQRAHLIRAGADPATVERFVSREARRSQLAEVQRLAAGFADWRADHGAVRPVPRSGARSVPCSVPRHDPTSLFPERSTRSAH